jgi:hypothetical protein
MFPVRYELQTYTLLKPHARGYSKVWLRVLRNSDH